MASSQPPPPLLSGIDESHSFYLEARAMLACAKCGTTAAWEAHHVLAKQHCRGVGAPLYSPDNALRLCAKRPDACHERHTTHQELVPLTALRDESIAFIARWLGAGAYDYLTRYYAGSDSRVDALLEIAAAL